MLLVRPKLRVQALGRRHCGQGRQALQPLGQLAQALGALPGHALAQGHLGAQGVHARQAQGLGAQVGAALVKKLQQGVQPRPQRLGAHLEKAHSVGGGQKNKLGPHGLVGLLGQAQLGNDLRQVRQQIDALAVELQPQRHVKPRGGLGVLLALRAQRHRHLAAWAHPVLQ